MTETNGSSSLIVNTAQYRRCQLVLEAMMEEATEDGIWQGLLTRKFGELGISPPYYGKTMLILKNMGCVEQIQRGAANQPSIWRIYRQMTPVDYELVARDMKQKEPASKNVHKRLAAVEGRLSDIEDMLRRFILNTKDEVEDE